LNEIYIVRHAAAAELDKEIVEDSHRYLTIHGRNHCKIVAGRLKDMKVQFDIVLSSPVIRAVQSAEIFASILKYEGEIKTATELIGGNSFSRFQQLLKRYSYCNRIAVFGHAPDVNIFCTNLIKNQNLKEITINFKNSSVCKIDYDIGKDSGKLNWFLNSENMKLIEL
jgi:phosphohistidine phosphatase